MLKHLMDMIFGDGTTVPKNPKLYRQERISKHRASQKPFNKAKARAAQKRARNSRKTNR